MGYNKKKYTITSKSSIGTDIDELCRSWTSSVVLQENFSLTTNFNNKKLLVTIVFRYQFIK